MQQYTVPQFIDVEAKIIGPITTRQFLIFLVAAILCFIFYKVFDFSLFLTLSILLVLLAGTFAFVKVNGRPFHFFLLNLIQTLCKPRLRVWNHRVADTVEKENQEIKYENVGVNKELNKARLAELSLIIDTKGRCQGGEVSENPDNSENQSPPTGPAAPTVAK